jgi:hypothetical protein
LLADNRRHSTSDAADLGVQIEIDGFAAGIGHTKYAFSTGLNRELH